MIYIHIPYCKQKCSYCNFHFSTSIVGKDLMIAAIKKELALRHHELESREIASLYFGGGTPSLLKADEIKSLVDEVLRYFDFSKGIEITLEANPDDLGSAFLKDLRASGVNRLSVGTQSFHEADLRLMNRAHTAGEAEDSIKRAQDHGFENLSIDLIYGSPRTGMEVWQDNLRRTVALGVPHVSSYALTVEHRTALQKWVSDGRISAPESSQQHDAFQYMVAFLQENGFQHYEISNFAKPGFHSRHNSAYWKSEPYLGLGPSAHSYNGRDVRSWNKANNTLYINHLDQDILPLESEVLSEKDQYNEMLMIGLRTIWGVDTCQIKQRFPGIYGRFLLDIQPKLESGLLEMQGDCLMIPVQHWFLADGIAADLFML